MSFSVGARRALVISVGLGFLNAAVLVLTATPLFAKTPAPALRSPKSTPSSTAIDVQQSTPVRVFDTTKIDGGSYINDHTLIQDDHGRWHLFGIFHREPADPEHEIKFVHAVNDEPDPASWRPGSFVVSADTPTALEYAPKLGETHLWAPHVARDGDRYLMVFQSGGADHDRAQIRMAVSRDLEHWKRTSDNPLFEDICEARDPMLKKIGAKWVIYYTRCADTQSRLSGVAYRTSTDLTHWSAPRMALVLHDRPLVNSGFSESPFVFEKDGVYYLSITSYPIDYAATFIYRSTSPFHFNDVPVARVSAHAPEWIESNGQLFMTGAGWGHGGLDLFKMTGF